MSDAEMALGHLRMLARSPVTKAFLIEETIRLADEELGPEQPVHCRCCTVDGECGHPDSPPYRALSPEARVKGLQEELSRVQSTVFCLQTKYELAASDERLKEQGIRLEDLWQDTEAVPLDDTEGLCNAVRK